MLPCSRNILKERYIIHSLRVDHCKIKRTPLMAYAVQSWTLTNTMEGGPMTWERKYLKKIYRLAYEHRYWRIKMKKFIINLNLQIL